MPSDEQIIRRTWTCRRCGRTFSVLVGGEHGRCDDPADFSLHATLSVTSVGRDFQGGIVGPGWTLEKVDLCDPCVKSLSDWFSDVEVHPSAQPPSEMSTVEP